MTRPIHFYDSANPAAIPSGVYAAVYVNSFPWPRAHVLRMHRVFCVSEAREAHWARQARCIAIEANAGQPEDAVPFLLERKRLGFNDGTVYTNRSNRGDIGERVKHAGLVAYEWCATLDGTMVLEPVPGLKQWAVQYQGGMHAAFDLSVLHGPDNFHAP